MRAVFLSTVIPIIKKSSSNKTFSHCRLLVWRQVSDLRENGVILNENIPMCIITCAEDQKHSTVQYQPSTKSPFARTHVIQMLFDLMIINSKSWRNAVLNITRQCEWRHRACRSERVNDPASRRATVQSRHTWFPNQKSSMAESVRQRFCRFCAFRRNSDVCRWFREPPASAAIRWVNEWTIGSAHGPKASRAPRSCSGLLFCRCFERNDVSTAASVSDDRTDSPSLQRAHVRKSRLSNSDSIGVMVKIKPA